MSRILYCEGLMNPVGISNSHPELTWAIEEEYSAQASYCITVLNGDNVIWASDTIKNQKQKVIVAQELQEDTEYSWILSWENKDGTTGKEKAQFSTGVFCEEHFSASWISNGTLLRKGFSVSKEIQRAVLYYTGLGYCKAYVNGEKTDDRVLFPSYTIYSKTIEYTACDVTEKIHSGENMLGLWTMAHWDVDQDLNTINVYSDCYYQGKLSGFAELRIFYTDGSKEIIKSDETWEAADSAILSSSVFDGESYDANLYDENWCLAKEGSLTWRKAELSRNGFGKLVYSTTPPIRIVKDIKPISVTKLSDKWIVDFGINFTGWIQLKLQEEKNTKIVVRHAETLYEDGNINVENLRAAKATDTYICKGNGEIMEPSGTYHGFRYAEITGMQNTLTVDDVIGRFMHSDCPEISAFSCGREEFNQIHEAMCQTINCNIFSVPTDCCQRDERQGWMADAGVSSEFAMLHFDMDRFYRKWFRDIRDSQEPDGAMPLAGAPGWPRDTFTWKIGWHMCLRSLYLMTGDAEAVKENYEALQKYENWTHKSLVNGLISYDFYNDWLAIEFANNLMIANAFLTDFYEAMILFAEVVDDENGKKLYEERLCDLKAAINREFYNMGLENAPDGTGYYGTCDTLAVAPSAMALKYEIVPEKFRDKVIREMIWQLTESKGSVQYPTGILTSGILNDALADLGRDDIVYQLLEREDYPSLRFMLSKGATTIWERWQYLVHNEMNSHNHPALCSLGKWFYSSLCGLRKVIPQKEGGAVLILDPYIPDDCDHAEMSVRTIWGNIRLSWEKVEGKIMYTIDIPGNTVAQMEIHGETRCFEGGINRINIS